MTEKRKRDGVRSAQSSTKVLRRMLSAAAVLFVLCLVFMTPASAAEGDEETTTTYVAYIGTQGYGTLQDAIDAANAGDTVKIQAGTYPVPSLKAGITLEGAVENGGVLFEGTLSGTLEDLTLKNIHIRGANAQRWAYAKGNLVFENVTFNATSVYAIHFDGIAEGTTLLYKDCTIIGWAAMGGSPESCLFEGCTIKDNGAYGVIRTYFDATIEDCTFDIEDANLNDAYQDGVHSVDATVIVKDCQNVNGGMEDIIHISGDTAEIPLKNTAADGTVTTVVYTTAGEVEKKVESTDGTVIYEIDSALKLKQLAESVNAGTTYAGETVKLTADIDLQNQPWTPIGLDGDAESTKFAGTFDGAGHTIRNLFIDTTADDFALYEKKYTAAGLFGATKGDIKNLIIDGADITHISTSSGATTNGIAVVAGSLYSTSYPGSIDNVVVKNATVKGNRLLGGISGYVYGTITNCKVYNVTLIATPDSQSGGTFDNGDKVGGIAGYVAANEPYVATQSLSGCDVYDVKITAYRDAGGILGCLSNAEIITNDLRVSNLAITIDQKTNSYGAKAANANSLIGRYSSGAASVIPEDNPEPTNVAITMIAADGNMEFVEGGYTYAVVTDDMYQDENQMVGILKGQTLTVPVNFITPSVDYSPTTFGIVAKVINLTDNTEVENVNFDFTTQASSNIYLSENKKEYVIATISQDEELELFTVSVSGDSLNEGYTYQLNMTVTGERVFGENDGDSEPQILSDTQYVSLDFMVKTWLIQKSDNVYNKTAAGEVVANPWNFQNDVVYTYLVPAISITDAADWPTVTRNATPTHYTAGGFKNAVITVMKTTGGYENAEWTSAESSVTNANDKITVAVKDEDATYLKIIFTGYSVGDVVGANDDVQLSDIDALLQQSVSYDSDNKPTKHFISNDRKVYADINADGILSNNDAFYLFKEYLGYDQNKAEELTQ